MKKILSQFLKSLNKRQLRRKQRKGTLVRQEFLATSLVSNIGGENPLRNVSVYLPANYDTSKQHYPTLYFLHGFSVDDTRMLEWFNLKELLDKAIQTGQIQPLIVVFPDSNTLFNGSFYTNSVVTGNWADYIGKDVVEYIDKNFRTIQHRNSRGLTGHSMGGNGALKMGMFFPDIFGTIYAMSPGLLNWSNDFTLQNEAFKTIATLTTDADVEQFRALPTLVDDRPSESFWAIMLISLARTYSPNPTNFPLLADIPIHYINNKGVENQDIIKKWDANFPINMIEKYLTNLKSLQALKMDWGRNDDITHIPATNLELSKKLEKLGVEHFAEEYIGMHVDKFGEEEGRFYSAMLPFFNRYLAF